MSGLIIGVSFLIESVSLRIPGLSQLTCQYGQAKSKLIACECDGRRSRAGSVRDGDV